MTEDAMERWPGYNKQSWRERFEELDRRTGADVIAMYEAVRIAAEARQHGDGEPDDSLGAELDRQLYDGEREATAREIVREDFRSRGFSEADIATYLEGSGGLPYHPADAMLRVAEMALALASPALPDTTGREQLFSRIGRCLADPKLRPSQADVRALLSLSRQRADERMRGGE